ncbi:MULTISPECIES: hypothetical protein [Pantoea]|uniref:CDI toxin immunity protein n=1 Tax=Pantoea TaxID=53335 RepID=UPI0003813CD7|nr:MULTISPECIES: hypothetical protein [Pantoea]KHD99754.1 hypothetical protein NL54_19055 [Pantoea stewartii]KHN59742.1 hypothetical protein OI73_20240 [Pantoea stewartii]MBC0854011.1 hypothetical protein [Pantoea stewartii]MCW0310193.1 hypothetical protein [Pantoea ananatis]MCW0341900.1 hypothetical protein [Pantoea ananatis]
MTLFEECKEALGDDFSLVAPSDQKGVVELLHKYFLADGNVAWSEIEYSDYEDINELLKENNFKNDSVFVFADDLDVPLFRTKLCRIADNIYDVIALSPKLFIFNDRIILHPLFPTEKIRFGINDQQF